MNIEAFHAELVRRVAGDRPNLALALARAGLLFVLAFTFLSGVVFTVVPLALMAADHLARHIAAPLARWLAAEPVMGFQLTVLFQVCLAIAAAWLVRHYLLLAATFAASRASALVKLAARVRRKPARAVQMRDAA